MRLVARRHGVELPLPRGRVGAALEVEQRARILGLGRQDGRRVDARRDDRVA